MTKKGCRPPYLRIHSTFPLCNSAEKMKNGALEYAEASSTIVPKACHRISKIRIRDKYTKYGRINKTKIWYLRIYYPNEFKIITQSKEVDIHSLIGNIGGYLGLFLGNSYNPIKSYCMKSNHHYLT